MSSVDPWLSPKAVAQVGIPGAALAFMLAVITGILPTPLMEGLRLIPTIYAQHIELASYLRTQIALQSAQCLNQADSAEEYKRCNDALLEPNTVQSHE